MLQSREEAVEKTYSPETYFANRYMEAIEAAVVRGNWAG
jgi:hypothetical protein